VKKKKKKKKKKKMMMMMMMMMKKKKKKKKKKKPRRGLLDPEDEGIAILRNFGNDLSHHIPKHLHRQQHCFENCKSLNPIALKFISQITARN
jgi:hypothetical protein